MACLRRSANPRRGGDVRCDEEGCELRFIPDQSAAQDLGDVTQGHCVLQLQLRTRDAEEPRTELTREVFEELSGFKLTDHQWAWICNRGEHEEVIPFMQQLRLNSADGEQEIAAFHVSTTAIPGRRDELSERLSSGAGIRGQEPKLSIVDEWTDPIQYDIEQWRRANPWWQPAPGVRTYDDNSAGGV